MRASRRRIAWLLLASIFVLPVLLFGSARAFRQDATLRLRARAFARGATFVDQRDVVLQRRGNDCGPAALAMALRQLGHPVPLAELQALITLTPRGCSLLDLREAALRCGVKARGFHLGRRELETARLPMILRLGGDHFVVATARRADGRVEVLDPALGRLTYRPIALAWRWDGNALVFES